MRAPVFTALILMSVTWPLGSIKPISIAAGPTAVKMFPQVGLKSTILVSTLTCAKK